MGWDNNAYYHPEKFGLTQIALVETEPNYDFDMTVVWQHEDGRVFWAQDSGCSCPSPFEDYDSLDDLTEISDDHDMAELVRYVLNRATSESFYGYRMIDVLAFMAEVNEAVNGGKENAES